MWNSVLKVARALGPQRPAIPQNWLAIEGIEKILQLMDFEAVKRESRQQLLRLFLGLGSLLKRYVAIPPGPRCLFERLYRRRSTGRWSDAAAVGDGRGAVPQRAR